MALREGITRCSLHKLKLPMRTAPFGRGWHEVARYEVKDEVEIRLCAGNMDDCEWR